MKYITDSKDLNKIRDGSGRIKGKPVLLANADMKTATKRIFLALSKNPKIALVAGLGLSVKSSAGQWVRISVPELKALVLDAFVLVGEQIGAAGRCRMEILSDVPTPFWIPTLLQGRWIDSEVESWFPPIIKQDKIKVISKTVNLRQLFARDDNRPVMTVPYIRDCDNPEKQELVKVTCRKPAEQLSSHLFRWAKQWPSQSTIKTYDKTEKRFFGMDLSLFAEFIESRFSIRTADGREFRLDRKIAALIWECCTAADSPLPPADYQTELEKKLGK